MPLVFLSRSLTRAPRARVPICAITLALALLGGCSSEAASTRKTPGAAPERTVEAVMQERATITRDTPLKWGLYQILWRHSAYARRVDEAVAPFARPPEYVMFYRDLARPFPVIPATVIRERGATPIVSLELWIWSRDMSLQDHLERINRGVYDDFFRDWAREAKQFATPIQLRFGFEFNGEWFSWSGNPEAFKLAWRRAHGIFAEVQADNVVWVWSPNVVSIPDEPGNDMHLYYPGDDVVDVIGVDGYNWGDDHDPWHTWDSFASIFAEVLTEFERRYPTKRAMIAEMGSCPDDPAQPGRRATWIREAHATLQHFPQVESIIWFNFDKRREGEHNWRIDADPESLRAFNETFARALQADETPTSNGS